MISHLSGDVGRHDREEEMLAKAMSLSLQEPSRINHEEEISEEEMLAMALALSMVEK